MSSYNLQHQPLINGAPNWSAVTPLTDFSFPWNPKPAPTTTFRAAVCPDDSFHFRFDIEDHDIVLGDGPTTNDKVLASDRAEIFFAVDPGLTSYYCLEIDPRGLVFDCHMRFYRQMDDSWSCPDFKINAHIEPGRYQVTGLIPLQTLRDLDILKPSSNKMITGLYRAEFTRAADGQITQDWISWINPKTESPDFHVPTSFGTFILP